MTQSARHIALLAEEPIRQLPPHEIAAKVIIEALAQELLILGAAHEDQRFASGSLPSNARTSLFGAH